jgi:hypothetical protein
MKDLPFRNGRFYHHSQREIAAGVRPRETPFVDCAHEQTHFSLGESSPAFQPPLGRAMSRDAGPCALARARQTALVLAGRWG